MAGTKKKGEYARGMVLVPESGIRVVKILLLLNLFLATCLMISHFALGEVIKPTEKYSANHALALSVVFVTFIVLFLNALGLWYLNSLYIPPSVATNSNQSVASQRHSDIEDVIGGENFSNIHTVIVTNRAEGLLTSPDSYIELSPQIDGERRDSKLQIQETWQLHVKPDRKGDGTTKGGGSEVIGKLDVGLGVSMFNWWKKDAQERREFEKKAKKRKKINPQKLPDRRTKQKFKYLAIIDFEATCMENEFINPQEIIEFPVHVLNSVDSSTKARFHHYVKPIHHPKLTDFCTNLTGITQEVVDLGKTFAEVWYEFREFMEFHGLTERNTLFCISGDWDLKTMWPNQARLVGLGTPPYFECWCNIKVLCGNEFAQLPKNIIQLLDMFGLKHVGHHHSGIDDVENIRNCVKYMLRKGVVFQPTSFLKDLIGTPGFG